MNMSKYEYKAVFRLIFKNLLVLISNVGVKKIVCWCFRSKEAHKVRVGL